MLNLSYEYKLKPTDAQVLEIERTLIICRKVWNYALRERKDWINSRKCPINACFTLSEYIIPADAPYPNYFVQAAGLTKSKEIYPELKTVNAQILQQVLRKLETAFVDMKRKGMGFPRFKNRYRMRSFVFPQMLKNRIVVSQHERRPIADLYAFTMREVIPEFLLPLKEPQEVTSVNLQSVVSGIYERGGYAIRIDYQQAVPPPTLSQGDRQWVEELLVKKNVET